MPEENKITNLLIFVVIILALCFGAYNFIYKPTIKDINNLESSLKLIDSEIKLIEGGNLMFKSVPEARAMIKKDLDALSQKMPQETDAPYVVNKFISIVGKGLNIDYNLIQPGAIVAEENYKRLPLNVEFEGDYANLNTYLAQLKNLPVTIRVDNMDIHKQGETGKLGIKIGLSAFMLPGGTEKPAAAVPSKPSYSYGFDPFHLPVESKPATKTESAVAGLRYSGYWQGAQMEAIINDDIYSAGQTVRGFKVMKVYKDRVVLEKSGKSYNLPIGGTK